MKRLNDDLYRMQQKQTRCVESHLTNNFRHSLSFPSMCTVFPLVDGQSRGFLSIYPLDGSHINSHMHVISTSYPCHIHVICMSYPCHNHVISMSCPCHIHVISTQKKQVAFWKKKWSNYIIVAWCKFTCTDPHSGASLLYECNARPMGPGSEALLIIRILASCIHIENKRLHS